MINRSEFYQKIRADFGVFKQTQIDGFEAILNHWEQTNLDDLRWLAYIFATSWHETAKTMQPIEEYGKGKGRKYGSPDPRTGKTYFGRGFVQLTWASNYEKMGKIINYDLYNKPELALDMNVSVMVMFEGMTRGLFTGKRLDQYFNDEVEDWMNARRIINILDKAALIGGYGRLFYAALQ